MSNRPGLRGWVLGLLVATGLAESTRAAEPAPPRGYLCRAASGPVRVDGDLNDAAWARAEWSADFGDIEGAKQPAPPLRTRVKLLWDSQFLYVGAELTEPHVWANLTEHDSVIFQDNDFEVFLDPDSDNYHYFEVEINAHATEWDLFLPRPYRDKGSADNGWEMPHLQKAVRVQGTLNDPSDTDTGWTVELAIPLTELAHAGYRAEAPRVGDQWRINFSRVEWDTTVANGQYRKVLENGKPRPEHNWVWSPQGVIDMHQPERWGILQFAAADGPAELHPDPAQATRDHLMAIYHAARAQAKTGRPWDGNLASLTPNLAVAPHLGAGRPEVRLTPGGFQASLSRRDATNQAAQVWTVDQDSRLTHQP